MQFGWLTLSLSPSGDEDAARIDQQIEQVCYAEQLGFSDVWLTEHYFTGESVYVYVVVIGVLSSLLEKQQQQHFCDAIVLASVQRGERLRRRRGSRHRTS